MCMRNQVDTEEINPMATRDARAAVHRVSVVARTAVRARTGLRPLHLSCFPGASRKCSQRAPCARFERISSTPNTDGAMTPSCSPPAGVGLYALTRVRLKNKTIPCLSFQGASPPPASFSTRSASASASAVESRSTSLPGNPQAGRTAQES